MYGTHGVGLTGVHDPSPLHVDAGVADPPVQLAALHGVDDPG